MFARLLNRLGLRNLVGRLGAKSPSWGARLTERLGILDLRHTRFVPVWIPHMSHRTRRISWRAASLGVIALTLAVFLVRSQAGFAATGTFGNSTVGATKYGLAADNKQGSKFTLSEAGDVETIHFNAKLGGGASSPFEAKGAIYADSAGSPGALLGTAQAVTITGTQQWYTSAFSAPVSLSAGTYWLVVHNGTKVDVFGDPGAANQRAYNADPYSDGPTDPFGASTQDAIQLSIYATYTIVAAPDQVTGLSATASGSQIDLSWTAPNDNGSPITGYKIERQTCTGSWSTLVADTGTTATTYSDTTVAANTCYDYRVSAINGVGTGLASIVDTATSNDVPGQVTGLSATPVSAQIDLSWTAPADGGDPITGYKIERQTCTGSWATLVADTGTTATTYSDTSVAANTCYDYRVSAINGVGTGLTSIVATATSNNVGTFGNTTVGATKYGWAADNKQGSKFTLSESGDVDTIHFNAKLGGGASSPFEAKGAIYADSAGSPGALLGTAQAVTITATQQWYTSAFSAPVSLSAGTYWLVVHHGTKVDVFGDPGAANQRAYNGDPYSDGPTDPFGASTQDAIQLSIYATYTISGAVPDQVTGLSATASGSQIDLSWTAPGDGGSPITGYKIERQTCTGSWSTLVADTGTTATTYSDTTVAANTCYDYRVSAINGFGTGLASIVATDTSNDVPEQVTGFSATTSGAQIDLSWTAPADGGDPITGYKIERQTCTGSWATLVADTGTTATTYSDTSVAANTCYDYRVSAINGVGTGLASIVATATSNDVPGQVTGLSANAVSGGIDLSWTAPGDGGAPITGYKIERQTCTGSWATLVADTGTTATTYSDTTVVANTCYDYRVSAINGIGTGLASIVATATASDVPAQVSGLSGTPVLDRIDLSWTAPADGGSPITGYKIERKTCTGSWATLIADTGTTATTYVDGMVAASTCYDYRVSAINGIGTGLASIAATATSTAFTFGYDTAGGTAYNHPEDIKQGSLFTLSPGATYDTLVFYGSAGAGATAPFTWKGTIYADSAGSPGALVATTAEATITSNIQWWSSIFSPAVTLGAGDYWLVVHQGTEIDIYGDTGTSNQRSWNADTYAIAPTVFTGTGLNDATSGGAFSGSGDSTFTIIIDSVGGTDTFKWQKDAGPFTTDVAMTGAAQTLSDGVTVTFAATTGHTYNDQWTIAASDGPSDPFGAATQDDVELSIYLIAMDSATPSLSVSTITASPTTIPPDGATASTITVQLTNANGIPLTSGGDTVELSTTLGTLSGVTDNTDGTYTATLTSNTVGSATITGTLNSEAMTDDATVYVTTASELTSTIVASPTSIVGDGVSTSAITVQLKDGGGSNLISGGDTVTLATTLGSLSTITDNGNGTYSATLTSTIATGTATITGTVNGATLTDNATVDFVPGAASELTSTISASPTTAAAGQYDSSTITVQLIDANGLNLTAGGDSVILSTNLGSVTGASDNGNGTYTATLTSSSTGTATVTGTVNSSSISDDATVDFVSQLGYSTAGGDKNTIQADNKQGSKFTMLEPGDANTFHFYGKVGGGGGAPFAAKGVIYVDNAGSPGAWVGTTQEMTVSGTLQWYSAAFSPAVSLTAGDYWLVVHQGTKIDVYGDNGDTNQRSDNADDYSDGPADPFGSANQDDIKLSIYIDYTASAPGVPLKVEGLSATAVADQIDLSWTEPIHNGSSITGYKIERRPCSGSWSTLVADTGTSATSYSDTSIAVATCYGYRVSAINSVGTGSASNEATATSDDVPAQISDLTATAFGTQIDLAWTAPTDGGDPITGYKIERRLCPAGSWSTLVADTGTTATTYSDTGLAISTCYGYRVSAINGVGIGVASAEATDTTSASTFLTFDTAGQVAYWYTDLTYPTGSGDASIAAGAYTLDMFFSQLPSWYDTDWVYRKKITIDNAKVSGTANLAYFPVLINTTDAAWAYTASGGKVEQPDGGDILFTNSSGNKLDHEIESYDNTNGALVAWVEVPTVSFDTDTDLYIYYGNNTGVANQWNINGTWDEGGANNFAAVWHLEETSGTHADSVINPMDATVVGDVVQNVTGQIAGADSFYDGSPIDDDSLITTDTTGSKVDITAALTLAAWILADADGGDDDQRIVHKRGVDTNQSLYGLYRLADETLIFRTSVDASNWQSTASTSTFTEGAWTHVAATYDDATDTVNIYINGVNGAGDTSTSHTQVIGTNDDYVEIGGVNGRDGRGFRGDIDEARISNTVRSADWIKTEFNNQGSPSTFFLPLGTEEQSPSVDIVVSVHNTKPDGSDAQLIKASATTTIDANTPSNYLLSIGSGDEQTYTPADPRRLRVKIQVTAVNDGGSFTLAYDSSAEDTSLNTPVVVVPENALGLVVAAVLIPILAGSLWRRRKLAARTVT